MDNIYQNLPKVMYIKAVDDAGEGGAGTCPHCGAIGRYIYWFVCADGTLRGAMKGCFSHFPKHPLADRYAKIIEKQREYIKKNWRLASWDENIKNAIERFAGGEITEQAAMDVIREADRQKKGWMKRRGYH